MKNILFKFAIIWIGLASAIFALADSFENEQILLVRHTESISGHMFTEIDAIEDLETERAGKEEFENCFCSDSVEIEESGFEVLFFISMLMFTVFLVALGFWRNYGSPAEFEQFD